MRRWTSSVVLLAAVVLGSTAGCSRHNLVSQPPPGDGGVTLTPSDASVTPTPTDASLTPTPSGPFFVAFRFQNDTAAPLYLHKACVGTDFGVSSGAAGFHDYLGPRFLCACACDDPSCTSPPLCGQCPASEGVQVAPGDTVLVGWDAVEVTDDQKPRSNGGAPFACVHSRLLPAGDYRVAVRVFDDVDAAAGNIGGRVVTRDFSLPSATVDVPLAVTALDGCDPAPTARAPTCTGAEAHDVPCSLGEALAFAWEGGLSFYGDASELVPPATYGRRRTFNMGTPMPDVVCAAPIPRCARDSRVVTTSDITRALNHPDVLAAYGSNTPVYGYDARANDGAVLILRRPDGTSLAIGSVCVGCSAASIARPLTPGLSSALLWFATLERQMLNTPTCVVLRAPGDYY
jgi:hypothetical protein